MSVNYYVAGHTCTHAQNDQCVSKQLKVQLNNQPALDTGGVRSQLYSSVYGAFARNEHVNLFDGPDCYQRPRCTAEARSSGLFKVLGTMVAHSIAQDGIGFPFFSPTCYCYIADGEERTMEVMSYQDVGCDVASLLTQVMSCLMKCKMFVSPTACIYVYILLF